MRGGAPDSGIRRLHASSKSASSTTLVFPIVPLESSPTAPATLTSTRRHSWRICGIVSCTYRAPALKWHTAQSLRGTACNLLGTPRE